MDSKSKVIKAEVKKKRDKNHPLTNFDIDDILSHVPKFKGCYMREQIPNLKIGESIIINLDDLDSDGSHWCACVCTKNLNLYFDSYGLPYPDELKLANPTKQIQ